MKEIDESVLTSTSIQVGLLYEIYWRSEIIKAIENVKDGKHYHSIVFMKYTVDKEFEPYELSGEHYFITPVATYGRKFTVHSFNAKNLTTYVVTKEENEIYKIVLKTERFEH